MRWSSISEPDDPNALEPEAHPISVTLTAGETLYIPAGWWHHVRQGHQGITIALNWWYDIEMQGMTWVILSFMRRVRLPAAQDEESEIVVYDSLMPTSV